MLGSQDLRYSLRTMRKSPGFTAVAVLSLALGIGANTAIFTFVNAALLKPLPYPESDRIVAVMQRPLKGGAGTTVAPRSFVKWHERAKSFEAIAIAQAVPTNTDGADGSEQVAGLWTTSEIFRVFGIAPAIGRGFGDQEGHTVAQIRAGSSGASGGVVLSHEYWTRRFASDPGVLGKTIRIGRESTLVIGVMPPGFRMGSLKVDIFRPLRIDYSNPDEAGSRGFLCYARLRPGVARATAAAEMATLARQIEQENALEKGWGVEVLGLREYLVRDNRLVLFVLSGVVGFVLVIACANLAGLLLTRGVGRRGEFALRASLGASRGRLIRQLVIESLVLSLAGGVLGLIVGSAASRGLLLLAQDAVAFGQMADAQMDIRVLGFTLLLSLLTALAFGLIPAWQASRLDLHTSLKEQGRGAGDTQRQQRFRAALVVGEVALSVVLLVGAGLLLRTFSRLLDVKLGFETKTVLTMRLIVMDEAKRRVGFVESMLDRVETLPDVQAAGTIQFLPLSGFTNNGPFHFVGRPQPAGPGSMESDVSTVSRGYFSAMGIPVLQGRPFDRRDHMDGPRVALVNQSFVNRYCPNENPIGLRILGDWANPKPTEIVGVVGDIRHNGLTAAPRPTVFLAQVQVPGYITYLVVRTGAAPEKLAPAIRRQIQQVDPNQAATAIQTMEQYVSSFLARPRLYAVLLGTFAALALLLAAIGLYGLIAYTVNRRTHEIGIRMALGARPSDILRANLGHGAILSLVGLTIGVTGAMWLTRLISNLLYEVSTSDVHTYVAVTGVLAGISLLAAYIPARRASKVDPMVALRHE